jgi:osmotically-inducible protein OsmY
MQAFFAGAAALLLAACDRPNTAASEPNTSSASRLDQAIDRTQARLAEAGEKTQQTLSETSDRLQPKIAAAGERISEAGSKVAENVKDAVRGDGGAPASATAAAAPDSSRNITTTITTGPRTSVGGLPEGTRAAVSDAAITTAVKAGFLKDPGLSFLKIDVDTKDGIVVLNGVADDAAARERAAQLAGDVRGVREVRNHLSVKQG